MIDPPPTPDPAASPRSPQRRIFARMGGNLGWLLGGRGFAAVVSIGYLTLAARALGPVRFGTFSLILAYGSAIANLAEFRSWQGVIRYGSLHIAAGHDDRLARLLGFTATLDWTAALIGAVLAAVGVQVAGPILGWSIEQEHGAALFGAVLLMSTGATATGVLRLYDRFDLLAYAETVGPTVRLVGAAIVWSLGGGVDAMLIVWALAALGESGAGWIAALAIRRTRFAFGRQAFMTAVAENPRIVGFMAQNSFSSSLSLLWQQAGTLAVGATGGQAAAGAFRIASKLAGALAKPVDTLTRVLYPELARLTAGRDRETLTRVAVRTTWAACLVAIAIVGVVWVGGPILLRVFSGPAYQFAQPYLVLLTIAAAIDLAGVAFEPILNAHGRSGRILGSRVIGAVAYLIVLGIALPAVGPIGAAIAAITSSLIIRGVLAAAVVRLVRDPG